MNAQELLQEISDYCRQTGLAESTFGRRAVNDGKLASRLRHGGRITTETLDRIRSFMATNRNAGARPAVIARAQDHPQAHTTGRPPETPQTSRPMAPLTTTSPSITPTAPLSGAALASNGADPQRNFRFFDNRQKYLLFVNTCSEKWVVANRVALELANIHPRPPAVRVFDAGVGDGTVLARVMRSMHDRFPTMPFYIVGKEISLEDIRLTMEVFGPVQRASRDRSWFLEFRPQLTRRAVARGRARRPAWSGNETTGCRKQRLLSDTARSRTSSRFSPTRGKFGKVSPKIGGDNQTMPVVLVI